MSNPKVLNLETSKTTMTLDRNGKVAPFLECTFLYKRKIERLCTENCTG